MYNKVEDRDYVPPKKAKKTKIDSNGEARTDTESEEESEENEDNEEEQRQLELKALGENNANMSKKYV